MLHEPNGETFGCLITNSAIEFGPGGEAANVVHRGFEILQKIFVERLNAAKESKKLRNGLDPKVAAVRLLALYQGVLVLVRGGYDLKIVKRSIDLEFNGLEEGSRDS